MKKVVFICCAVAALFMAASCTEKGPEGYQGINYITLSSESSSMYDTEDASLNVKVELIASLKEDLSLTFITDDTEDIITLEGNPVTIKAGETTASFTIRTAAIEANSKEFTVSLDKSAALPEKVQWSEDFKFTVKSSLVEELTEAQLAIVEAYKAATGVDLAKYLGIVNVSVEYTYYDFETGELCPAPKTWNTASVIELSEDATAEVPVLKMTGNPMGMEEEMYRLLRIQTVENMYWTDEDAGPEYKTLMNGINWNADSEETFIMTLDGITLNSDKSIDFVGTALDSYGDEIAAVAFDYYFSAYERELAATLEIEEGSDATANPYLWLFSTGIDEDYWENEDGVYEEASASISNEKMEFTYCFDYYGAGGYDKVVATYTPNK